MSAAMVKRNGRSRLLGQSRRGFAGRMGTPQTDCVDCEESFSARTCNLQPTSVPGPNRPDVRAWDQRCGSRAGSVEDAVGNRDAVSVGDVAFPPLRRPTLPRPNVRARVCDALATHGNVRRKHAREHKCASRLVPRKCGLRTNCATRRRCDYVDCLRTWEERVAGRTIGWRDWWARSLRRSAGCQCRKTCKAADEEMCRWRRATLLLSGRRIKGAFMRSRWITNSPLTRTLQMNDRNHRTTWRLTRHNSIRGNLCPDNRARRVMRLSSRLVCRACARFAFNGAVRRKPPSQHIPRLAVSTRKNVSALGVCD